jgi:predicted nucleic acid-binding protein
MPFVADNSVIVAWFIASQSSTETEALLERAATEDVFVPVIWRAEFAAILLAFSHNRRLSPARVSAILDEIDQLGFVHDPAAPSARTLVDIGRRYSLSAYDACYLELAMRLRLPIAVRDAALRKASVRAGLKLA